MKKYTIFRVFIFCMMLLWVSKLSAQDSSHIAYEDDLYKLEIIILRDTVYIQDSIYVSHLNDVTERFNMSFDEYSKQLLEAVKEQDSANVSSLERIYLNYLMPMYYPSFIEHRYIVRNYSVETKDNFLKMDIHNMRLPLAYCDSVKMDVVVVCRGDVNTDNFLKSEYYRSSCLEQLFISIDKTKQRSIKGINLYFPDFSFKEKRAMAQFIKSASLVIDSCHVKTIRGLSLYATFDKDISAKNKDFLCGLTQMADSILLVDSKNEGWMRDSIVIMNKNNSKNISWLAKVRNQYYLARYHLSYIPINQENEELSPQYLRALMNSDYWYNTWEQYFFALIVIFFVVIVISISYWIIPRFSFFLNNNMTYLYSLIIMLILEIYLLFVCMIESMSKEDIFTFGGDDKSVFLFFPLLFVFILPMLNTISKRKDKP